MFISLKLRASHRLAGVLLSFFALNTHCAPAQPVEIESLTWTQVRDRLQAGSTTVLVPIGGTEQNGPYMVLGKHNVRARLLADKIARELGNALVAPVMAYVPEGSIHPPVAHMRFPGTISIPTETFEQVLEATARSFKQHGFHNVFFLGDHGGYQKSESAVANKLNREWAKDPSCRVHALLEYYQVTETAYVAALEKRGFSVAEIGKHAGLADTSLAMALDPDLVLSAALARGPQPTLREGVNGQPLHASVDVGQIGVNLIVESSVAAIRRMVKAGDAPTSEQLIQGE